MNDISKKIEMAIHCRNPRDLALGWLRYEALRKLGPKRFAELCERNIKDGERFDDMVDELIVKGDK